MNLFGRRRGKDEGESQGLSDDMRQELEDPEVRRAAILGALSAGLLIGLVYVAIFGIVIFLMLKAWGV